MGYFKKIFICLFLAVMIGCGGSTADVNLEAAKFDLDAGNWDDAIQKASEVFRNDLDNVDAALTLASALAGKGGFKVIELAEALVNTAKSHDRFEAIHDELARMNVDTLQLHYAIQSLVEILSPQPDISHPLFLEQKFEAALLMMIEIYSTSALAAQPTADGPIDVNDITDDIKNVVQDDYFSADRDFAKAGLTPSDDLVKSIRHDYCLLKTFSTSSGGFDLAALRDMNLCQLSSDPDSLSKDNGDFQSPLVNKCSDFDNATECDSPEPIEL